MGTREHGKVYVMQHQGTELVSKATKKSLAESGDRLAKSLDKQTVIWVAAVFTTVGLEIILRWLGWFVLLPTAVFGFMAMRRMDQVETLRSRSAAYRSIKPTKIIRRDSYR